MKIWGEIPKIFGVYNKHRNVNNVNSTFGIPGKKDVVSISTQAKDFQTVMRAIRDVPDVRADKVSELSQKYQSGNYDVSGKDIADKIIKSVLDKKV